MLAEQPVADATAVWSRIKGVHGLSFASQCAALALVRWREAAAQRSDRPRRWLLADEALLAIAAALPQRRRRARGARGLEVHRAQRAGDARGDRVAQRRGAASRGARERRAADARQGARQVAARARARSTPPRSASSPRSSPRSATSSASPSTTLLCTCAAGWRAKELAAVLERQRSARGAAHTGTPGTAVNTSL